MRAGYIIVTGTDLTQTSASGSFKSELDLMHAYSDWASAYTLIRKSRAVRKLRTIIGPRWDYGIDFHIAYYTSTGILYESDHTTGDPTALITQIQGYFMRGTMRSAPDGSML